MQSCDFARRQPIADLHEVSVRVPKIDGQDPPGSAVAFVWTRHNLDTERTEGFCDVFDRVVRENAVISASRYGLAREVRCCPCVLQADLVCSEVERPLAWTLLAGFHAQDSLVERDRATHVANAKNDVVETGEPHRNARLHCLTNVAFSCRPPVTLPRTNRRSPVRAACRCGRLAAGAAEKSAILGKLSPLERPRIFRIGHSPPLLRYRIELRDIASEYV